MEDEKTENAAPPAKKSGNAMMMIVMVAAAAAAGAGGWFMGHQGGGKAAPSAEHGKTSEHGGDEHGDGHGEGAAKVAQFIPMDPAFVVNLSDETGSRYLQIELQLMSRDASAKEKIEQFAPLLRNHLLLLFGQQKFAELQTREDKERLQAAALDDVKKVLEKETGKPVVDALYFTSFVTQ